MNGCVLGFHEQIHCPAAKSCNFSKPQGQRKGQGGIVFPIYGLGCALYAQIPFPRQPIDPDGYPEQSIDIRGIAVSCEGYRIFNHQSDLPPPLRINCCCDGADLPLVRSKPIRRCGGKDKRWSYSPPKPISCLFVRFPKNEYIEKPHVGKFRWSTWRCDNGKRKPKYLSDGNPGSLWNRIEYFGHQEVGIAFSVKCTGNKPIRNSKLFQIGRGIQGLLLKRLFGYIILNAIVIGYLS